MSYIEIGFYSACFACVVWACRSINWGVVANRSLNWLAAIGVFLLCDAVGVQQLAADCLQRVSWNVTQGK